MFLVESKEHACWFSHYATISDPPYLVPVIDTDAVRQKKSCWLNWKRAEPSCYHIFCKASVFLQEKRLHVSQTLNKFKIFGFNNKCRENPEFLANKNTQHLIYSVWGLKHPKRPRISGSLISFQKSLLSSFKMKLNSWKCWCSVADRRENWYLCCVYDCGGVEVYENCLVRVYFLYW